MTILERLSTQGIRRIGSPRRGFRYRRRRGAAATRAERERIAALRIPPAWTDVAISPSRSSPVQAIGRDAAGRWQYLYHDNHVARRERRKQLRLIRFIEALPRMRRAVERDLRRPGLPREKVLAGMLVILGTCFIRPGSEEYVHQNGSYGLATLRRRHVSVTGDRVRFDFVGKSAKRQQQELRDRRLARLVRALIQYPGEVFKFRAEDGTIVDVRTKHINSYIKEATGEQFSAKDFRTWAANLICACALARTPEPTNGRARKGRLTAAIREVAVHLGNTPAVCRASYILDSLITHYENGRALRNVRDLGNGAGPLGSVRTLERNERALAAFLRRAVAARS